MSLFKGLSAFPISPLHEGHLDQKAFDHLLDNLLEAKVNSIGILGSTGCYPFLSIQERKAIVEHAIKKAGNVPVFASIGAISLRDILRIADDAQKAGVKALLLPAMSYFPLREEEVLGLFEKVNKHVSCPIIVYDNPGATQFHFSAELLKKICSLTHVEAVKFPSGYPNNAKAEKRFSELKHVLPSKTNLGVSGDPNASTLLKEGATCWYSEWGGLFPNLARKLTKAAFAKDDAEIKRISSVFAPFWKMSDKYGGSLRVIASTAHVMGLTHRDVLPLPLELVSMQDQHILKEAVQTHKPS